MIDRGSRFVAHAGSAASLMFWAICLLFISWVPVDDSLAMRMTDSDWHAEAMRRFGVMAAISCVATLACFAWTTIYFFPLRYEWNRLAAWWLAVTATAVWGGSVLLALRFLEVRPWF